MAPAVVIIALDRGKTQECKRAELWPIGVLLLKTLLCSKSTYISVVMAQAPVASRRGLIGYGGTHLQRVDLK